MAQWLADPCSGYRILSAHGQSGKRARLSREIIGQWDQQVNAE